MNGKKSSMAADIAYLALFLLLFVCMAFMVFSEDTAFNVAALCVVFAVMIVTHFTSVTLGLIVNVVVIFVGFTWYLYRSISYGSPIKEEFYFWAVASPILTVVSYVVFRNMQQIEEENERLRKRVQHFSVIDDVTELKNIQAYEMEFPVYRRIAERYGIGLMLIVWQLKYEDDLEKMLGKNGMEESAVELSEAVKAVFRKEDIVYILSREPYEWGSLMLSNEDSEELLRQRIKEKLENIDFTGLLGKNAPRLEMRVGVHFAKNEEETALSMLEKAEKALQYDV